MGCVPNFMLILILLFLLSPVPWVGAGDRTREVTDGLGRKVRLNHPPERIVSLAPSLTEIAFSLGLGGKVVGVTDFCDYPPEARARPKIGGMVNPSLEAIVALKPDLVLATTEGNRPETVAGLERLGIAVYVVNPKCIEGVLSSIEGIGRATGTEEAAMELVKGIRKRLNEVAGRLKGISHLRVLYLIWPEPLIVPGKETLINDLIQRAGGENISGNESIPYPLFSMEEVVARRPEVIIVSSKHGEGDIERLVQNWRRFKVPAVGQGRVHFVNGDLINRPGPRIAEGLEALARMIHPEAFQ